MKLNKTFLTPADLAFLADNLSIFINIAELLIFPRFLPDFYPILPDFTLFLPYFIGTNASRADDLLIRAGGAGEADDPWPRDQFAKEVESVTYRRGSPTRITT